MPGGDNTGLAADSWRSGVFNRRMSICVFTGFASGMPLYVVLQMLPAWLRDQSVGLSEIGLFALVQIPYVWKFMWAPMMDRYAPPLFGRRRGWMLATQIGLFFLIGFLGMFSPERSLRTIAALALALTFFSASQDVVLDGYRREILPDRELGLGNSVHITTYRVSSLVPGSLGLVLADHIAWNSVFWVVAAFMFVGILLSLAISEPESELPPHGGFRDAVVAPFREYVDRRGPRRLALVLSFMLLYKLGDNMAVALATPFYIDLGFTKTEIGLIAKHAALWPSILGGLLGGLGMLRMGIDRALWIFGLVQMVSILGYAVLSEAGNVQWLLAAVIGFEYLGVGMGTAAITAYIARETSKLYAATQFALFTAITAMPRTFANAATGWIVETIGWTDFFLLCAALAIPGMLLLWWVAPWPRTAEK